MFHVYEPEDDHLEGRNVWLVNLLLLKSSCIFTVVNLRLFAYQHSVMHDVKECSCTFTVECVLIACRTALPPQRSIPLNVCTVSVCILLRVQKFSAAVRAGCFGHMRMDGIISGMVIGWESQNFRRGTCCNRVLSSVYVNWLYR
jgi:hypothetical protein